MPHIIVEYTDNLSDRLDVKGLLNALHDATVETKAFPVSGIRTRAIRHDTYVVANKAAENAFIHVVARIGVGRSEEVKKSAGDHINKALVDFTNDIFESTPLALGFEFVEISTWKRNNLPG